MPGPYFKGQEPSACGCFFPDVTHVRDDPVQRQRTWFCIVHGDVTIPHGHFIRNQKSQEIPSEEWREKERAKLRAIIKTPRLEDAVFKEMQENPTSGD